MSEIKLISPLLDNFAMGEPFSDHDGIRCCPAIEGASEDKYIVKIISIPASQVQLDALLLTGAYPNEEAALEYFKELTNGIRQEVQVLRELSSLEGFFPYTDLQVVPMEDDAGFYVYLLSPYRKTLERCFSKSKLTHLDAINLGLDLCAALAVCRRSGYLYGNLKPENIYLTENKQYRIGDLGFLRLDSLKYQSLPDKYRSVYTAPEITDAFSSLNTTLDVYAAGMVLYQVFNGGTLPFTMVDKPDGELPPPAYADLEMTQIILKACAPNWEDRWKDPIEMGQALVGYMQRNGAHETPIVPEAQAAEPEPVAETTESSVEKTAPAEEAKPALPEITYEEVSEDLAEILAAADDLVAHPVPDPAAILEEAAGQEDPAEEAAEAIPEEIREASVETAEPSAEESSAETQGAAASIDPQAENADATPSVADEKIDIPEVIPEESDEEPEIPEVIPEETDELTAVSENAEPDQPEASDNAVLQVSEANVPEEPKEAPKKHRGRILRNVILVLMLLGILGGAAYYYLFYYLQPIHAIVVDGNQDNLTVLVTTDIPEEKLTVICTDIYGTEITAPVINGKAEFKGLTPNMGYNIKISINGFHRLIGDTTTAYSTPVLTNIPQFTILNGAEAGTVLLSFNVDGRDTDKWAITYSASDEPAKTISFSGHTYTLTGLSVGKEYTFDLSASADLYITGNTHALFTPEKPLAAEGLSVVSCANGKLQAAWTSPAGVTINSWTVRCYNGTDYDKTIVVNDCFAEFDGLNCADGFTVVVSAENMSVNTTTMISANSINVTDFVAASNKTGGIQLNWTVDQGTPPAGWILTYGITGTDITDTLPCSGNEAVIPAAVPGASYWFTLQTAEGKSVIHMPLSFTLPQAADFTCTYMDGDISYTVSKENLTFSMCKTPEIPNWTKDDLSSSDYTTVFAPNEKASFLVQLNKPYGLSNEIIVAFYVVTDSDGDIVSTSSTQSTWTNMWYKRHCELDIPALPTVSGNYSMNIYFNGMLAGSQEFTIS